jgi:hypothetical protein
MRKFYRFHGWLIFARVIALFMFVWPYVCSHILCTQLVICLLSHFIMSPKQSLGDILCLLRFLLPYSSYYYSSFFLSFFRQKFVRHISRRCLDQALWNLVGISYAMWSCACKGWFFQNGCHCHGNGQNAKKMKNTKMIIAGYSPNRNWWNWIGTTSTSSGTR